LKPPPRRLMMIILYYNIYEGNSVAFATPLKPDERTSRCTTTTNNNNILKVYCVRASSETEADWLGIILRSEIPNNLRRLCARVKQRFRQFRSSCFPKPNPKLYTLWDIIKLLKGVIHRRCTLAPEFTFNPLTVI